MSQHAHFLNHRCVMESMAKILKFFIKCFVKGINMFGAITILSLLNSNNIYLVLD